MLKYYIHDRNNLLECINNNVVEVICLGCTNNLFELL